MCKECRMMIDYGCFIMPFGQKVHTSTSKGKNMERNVPFKVLGCMNFLGCAFQNLVMAVIAYFVLFLLNRISLGQLATSPMTNFTLAKLTLLEHSKQNVHIMSSMDVMEFKN